MSTLGASNTFQKILKRPEVCAYAILWAIQQVAKPMPPMNPDHLLKSFLLRQKEGDREAREVFAEFIRVVTERSNEESVLREVAILDEHWRDSLSDSEVVKHLRAIHPIRRTRTHRGKSR